MQLDFESTQQIHPEDEDLDEKQLQLQFQITCFEDDVNRSNDQIEACRQKADYIENESEKRQIQYEEVCANQQMLFQKVIEEIRKEKSVSLQYEFLNPLV